MIGRPLGPLQLTPSAFVDTPSPADEKKVDGKEDEKIQGTSPLCVTRRADGEPEPRLSSERSLPLGRGLQPCRLASSESLTPSTAACPPGVASPRRRRYPDPQDLRPYSLSPLDASPAHGRPAPVPCARVRGRSQQALPSTLADPPPSLRPPTPMLRVKVLTPGSSRRSRPTLSTSKSGSTRRLASRRATRASPRPTYGTSRPTRYASPPALHARTGASRGAGG
jgi:hypothetical protein